MLNIRKHDKKLIVSLNNSMNNFSGVCFNAYYYAISNQEMDIIVVYLTEIDMTCDIQDRMHNLTFLLMYDGFEIGNYKSTLPKVGKAKIDRIGIVKEYIYISGCKVQYDIIEKFLEGIFTSSKMFMDN